MLPVNFKVFGKPETEIDQNKSKLKIFRFSRQLHPIFDAAANAMVSEEQIVFGRVDCDREQTICKEFAVNKVCWTVYTKHFWANIFC